MNLIIKLFLKYRVEPARQCAQKADSIATLYDNADLLSKVVVSIFALRGLYKAFEDLHSASTNPVCRLQTAQKHIYDFRVFEPLGIFC